MSVPQTCKKHFIILASLYLLSTSDIEFANKVSVSSQVRATVRASQQYGNDRLNITTNLNLSSGAGHCSILFSYTSSMLLLPTDTEKFKTLTNHFSWQVGNFLVANRNSRNYSSWSVSHSHSLTSLPFCTVFGWI